MNRVRELEAFICLGKSADNFCRRYVESNYVVVYSHCVFPPAPVFSSAWINDLYD